MSEPDWERWQKVYDATAAVDLALSRISSVAARELMAIDDSYGSTLEVRSLIAELRSHCPHPDKTLHPTPFEDSEGGDR